jgi:hypothetical protein
MQMQYNMYMKHCSFTQRKANYANSEELHYEV